MNAAKLIYQEAKILPDSKAQEVLDFLMFLKEKSKQVDSSANGNEPIITPEQHHAWVEEMRAITAAQSMTHITMEDIRCGDRY